MSGAESFFEKKADRVEALLAESGTISEDLQHGQIIEEQLRITNPFEGH